MSQRIWLLVIGIPFFFAFAPFFAVGALCGIIVFGFRNGFSSITELNDWLNKISEERTDAERST